MAVSFSVDTNILDADVSGINRALADLQKSLGQYSAQAPRIAACFVCDSLRAKTKVAPKYPKRTEWNAASIRYSGFIEIVKDGRRYKIPTPSPYITRRGKIIHRYDLTRHVGTENEITYPVGVYKSSSAAELSEIRKFHLVIRNRGIAKKSWNWAKGQLGGNAAGDTVYQRRKNDRRNPRDSVFGKFKSFFGITKTSAEARVLNRIDYILSSLKSGSVEEAVANAALKIAWRSATAQKMSPRDAADYARKLLEGVKSLQK